MHGDTAIGGPGGAFPPTRGSLLAQARGSDLEQRRLAWDDLVAAYWKPVYKYLRIRWKCDNERAKDLTQGFFAHCVERGGIDRYDPERAAFRTFLRTCLDHYVSNQNTADARRKRGGDRVRVELDFADAERELGGGTSANDDVFDREWVRSLWTVAVETLRDRLESDGRAEVFAVFAAYDLVDDPVARGSYADLAGRFNLPITQITNHLAAARGLLRVLLLERLRAVTGSHEEFRDEARRLFGVAP